MYSTSVPVAYIGYVSDLIGGLSTCVSSLSLFAVVRVLSTDFFNIGSAYPSFIGLGATSVSICYGTLLQALIFGVKLM